MKQWKCGVCGYIHRGDEPPEKCPVCGADKSMFIDVSEPEAVQTQPEEKAAAHEPVASPAPEMEKASPFAGSRYQKIFELMTRHHAHPITVHIPNGVLPISVIFIFLSAVFSIKGMTTVATYNLAVVVLSMPAVLFSGYVTWQERYGGALTDFFIIKICCGIIISITSAVLLIWLLINPEVVYGAASARVIFFALNIIMLAAAVTAGVYGGKLVFRD